VTNNTVLVVIVPYQVMPRVDDTSKGYQGELNDTLSIFFAFFLSLFFFFFKSFSAALGFFFFLFFFSFLQIFPLILSPSLAQDALSSSPCFLSPHYQHCTWPGLSSIRSPSRGCLSQCFFFFFFFSFLFFDSFDFFSFSFAPLFSF